jgi:hypothetical protein
VPMMVARSGTLRSRQTRSREVHLFKIDFSLNERNLLRMTTVGAATVGTV